MTSTHPAEIKVEGVIYGFNRTRVEFELTLPVNPPSLMTDRPKLNGYAGEKMLRISADAKHCHAMACEFCGKPARETLQVVNSYFDVPPRGQDLEGEPSPGPMLDVWIHAVCNSNGACGKRADALSQSKSVGALSSRKLDARNLGDQTINYPLNASCLGCMKEITGKETLPKCARCMFTQYCGIECQKKDWPRHKVACKWIKGARFVNAKGDVKIWKANTSEEWEGGRTITA